MKDDYKKMYLHLFNAVTDALVLLPEDNRAAQLLRTQKTVFQKHQTTGLFLCDGHHRPHPPVFTSMNPS